MKLLSDLTNKLLDSQVNKEETLFTKSLPVLFKPVTTELPVKFHGSKSDSEDSDDSVVFIKSISRLDVDRVEITTDDSSDDESFAINDILYHEIFGENSDSLSDISNDQEVGNISVASTVSIESDDSITILDSLPQKAKVTKPSKVYSRSFKRRKIENIPIQNEDNTNEFDRNNPDLCNVSENGHASFIQQILNFFDFPIHKNPAYQLFPIEYSVLKNSGIPRNELLNIIEILGQKDDMQDDK